MGLCSNRKSLIQKESSPSPLCFIHTSRVGNRQPNSPKWVLCIHQSMRVCGFEKIGRFGVLRKFCGACSLHRIICSRPHDVLERYQLPESTGRNRVVASDDVLSHFVILHRVCFLHEIIMFNTRKTVLTNKERSHPQRR